MVYFAAAPLVSFSKINNSSFSTSVLNRLNTQKIPTTCSPPYKSVRTLCLRDSPTTPKTLIQKSVLQTPVPSRCGRFSLDKPRPSKISPNYQKKSENVKPAANVNPFTPNSLLMTARKRSRSKRSLNG